MDYNSYRRKTNGFRVGNVGVGADYPVTIQSMTNTSPYDHEATYRQIRDLEDAGCDIIRLAIPDIEAAALIKEMKARNVKTPLVADIHFDYRIALAAIEAGVDKIRINPGNIGSREKTEAVVRACKEREIPIRIGVNSGSVEKSILEKYGSPTAEALCESALFHAAILEDMNFDKIAISVKASTVSEMIEANRILAKRTSYPLHLGVTEAGFGVRAAIKSGVGIGALLAEGIGDTIRVSLTENPVREVALAKDILSSLGISERGGMDIVSCPTCGRTKIDLIRLVSEFEEKAKAEEIDRKNIKVALMGCAVNGPGEAREADIGIAGGEGEGLLFKKGQIIRKISEDSLVDELIREIKLL